MKKFFKSTVAVCIVLLACALLFASCEGDSQSKPQNDTPAETTTPGLHEHIPGEWIIDKEATLTEKGQKHQECSVCGVTLKTEDIPMLMLSSNGLEYSVNSDGETCTITGLGTCTDTDIFIGEYIDEYRVTAIGDFAFEGCSDLTSVTIGNSVTEIGWKSFSGCSSLRSIEIPDSVTSIDESVFSDTEYYNTSSNWEEDVLYIGRHLIDANTSISDSYVIKAGTKTIAVGAFEACSSLTSVEIPDSVTSIGAYTFYNCSSLTSIEIPDSVTSIGDRAFEGCSSLTSIEIPNSVTSIGENAFSDTEYYNTSSNWEDGVLYIGKHLINANDMSISGLYEIKEATKTVADDAFYSCSRLIGIEIPDSVTSIGGAAFYGCTSLTSIEIPNSVTSIGESAFAYCSSLTSIEIPNSVTSIGDYAFEGCSSLTSIEIPDSVTSIGDYAFGWCSSLTSIEIPNSVTSISDYAFSGCENIESIIVDENNEKYYSKNNCLIEKEIQKLIFGCKNSIIPKEVRSIGDSAFSQCSSLTSIEIPDSVTSIGKSAFAGCSSLTNVIIGNGVTSIGNSTFLGCDSLTSIEIPDSVTSIGDSVFYGCSSLTSIEIPDSVTTIGERSFEVCSSLTSVIIGNGVTSIGDSVFYGCSRLTKITYTGTMAEWNEIVKERSWDSDTGSYTIYCTDGEIEK